MIKADTPSVKKSTYNLHNNNNNRFTRKNKSMKVKIVVIAATLLLALNLNAQNTSVEKSIWGIQTGFLGIWINNELKLSESIALRSEIGLDLDVFDSDFGDIKTYLSYPVITIEPRWYYNFKKRVKKTKRTDGNSANFISIKTSYHPDWFVISHYENVSIISDLSIVPTWGIRRNVAKHFNYETGIGIGYRYTFLSNYNNYRENVGELWFNLHLRIGYKYISKKK